MVRGIERFQRHFAGHEETFVLIGGAACDIWFTRQGASFRSTKDIDMVLLLDAGQPLFLGCLREFIRDGGYKVACRHDGKHAFYRFINPAQDDFPTMIELLSPAPPTIELAEGQQVIPLKDDHDASSLSAILMDPDYYRFILSQREVVNGLPLIKPSGLIPLKARAWLDLTRRRADGDMKIRRDEINKHRTDVFRLATLLPVGEALALPMVIAADMAAFLSAFPENSPEWDNVGRSLASSRIRLPANELIAILDEFFGMDLGS